MRSVALLLAVLLQGTGFAPFDVGSLAMAPPTTIAQLERRALRGEPSRLAWSPDGAMLYIQSRDGVGAAAQLHHFRIRLGYDGIAPLDEEPSWAADYWHNKVTEAAPGMPWLTIDVALDRQRTRVAPFTGGFASAGAASGSESASSFTIAYVTLSFLGVEIGKWMTDEPKSGVTFGWGPAGSGALAFADRQGRLTLLDKERRLRTVPRTQDVSLPAWSPDGNYVAYIQKQGRSKWQVESIALLRVDSALQ
jgi:dipeptidyl aminopeptidase/acylaminoacyl peptidase